MRNFFINFIPYIPVIFSIFAILIACCALRQSIKANKIANEANELVKLGMLYSKDQTKQVLIFKIVDTIVAGWSKKAARKILKAEWEIHKQDLTMEDFNNIWKFATWRVKGKKPKKTAEEILNEIE